MVERIVEPPVTVKGVANRDGSHWGIHSDTLCCARMGDAGIRRPIPVREPELLTGRDIVRPVITLIIFRC